MTRDGLAKSVEEDWSIRGSIANEGEQNVDGRGPERATANFPALPCELNDTDLVSAQVQIADQKRCGLGDASARVIEEQQKCVVAQTLLRAAVGDSE
jgi:hypothetical protein